MTVTDITKNVDELTMTVTTRFAHPVDRVWQLWADPRQLERWWGPPAYPATVQTHDLRPGGSVSYFMTGPEGDQHHGYWRVVDVDAPHRLEVEDGFADEQGRPNADLPVTAMVVTLSAVDDGSTEMVMWSRFPSREAMQQMIEMGMEEGLREALGQIEAVLAQ